MIPQDISEQAALILRHACEDDKITNDPAQLSAILNTAAQACREVHSNNLLMQAAAAQMKNVDR